MRTDDRRPVIVGCHEGETGDTALGALGLSVAAAAGALRDAGLTPHDVDAVLTAYAWEEPSFMQAALLAEQLGVRPDYSETVCMGGASPCAMVGRASAALRAGTCEVAVLTVGSNRSSGLGRQAAIESLREVVQPEFEGPTGAFVPAMYALVAQRYLYEYGAGREQLAEVAVVQRDNAVAHPGARFHEPITVDDVLRSKPVSSPLTLLDCCLVTNFSAALVMTTAGRARELGRTPVEVLGTGEATGPATLTLATDLTRHGAVRSGRAALAEAGLTTADIDFAELYDCFTVTVLITLEDLGFCPKGTAGDYVRSGATRPGGELPVNTNGGMLSYATGGMFHLTEAVRQLRGDPAGIRLDAPRTALVHGVGGVFSTNSTVVLARGETP